MIRPATREDAAALAAIQDRAWREGFRGLVEEHPPVEAVRERFEERLERDDRALLVAEEDGLLRGFVSFGAGEIHALYVDPSAWRRGIGAGLLESALAGLRAAGEEHVTLWSLSGNARATAFYEANGFEADGPTRTRSELGAPELRFRRGL